MRPVFAPDGKSVAYMAGGGRVLATTIDGRETKLLFQLKNGKSVNIFDWSPDGRHIVFTPGNKEIWCAPTNGGEPFQVAELPEADESQVHAWLPKWSPAGDSVAFTVSREKYQYWVMENFLPPAEASGR
jgi:Tol biopolymer transport system component